MNIPLFKNKKQLPIFAIVDDCDYFKVSGYTWHIVTTKSYKLTSMFVAIAYHNNKRIRMHHLITAKKYGYKVRHVDCQGLNNSRSNLQYVAKHKRVKSTCGLTEPGRTADLAYRGGLESTGRMAVAL